MKRITVLGSTGSIGTQTLEVIRTHPGDFSVYALTCGRNIELFRKQLAEFSPVRAAAASEQDARRLAAEFPQTAFEYGKEGIASVAEDPGADMVVNALLGMMGIEPTLRAIRAGRDIAFANKETLVAAGELIMDAVRRASVRFLPVDSEHSAIFQCLQGGRRSEVKSLILTASGGPFRGYSAEQLSRVTVEQALRHPSWNMGAKITVDSATLMNKGLEVIEARWLFDVQPADIRVVVHPQSVVHSAVEFCDGCVIAQLGVPDMKMPIAYALSYPDRLPYVGETLRLTDYGSLSFERPDFSVFRCPSLAYAALREGGSCPAALNAANEEAVSLFLAGKIGFCEIAERVERALQHHQKRAVTCVEEIFEVERETRAYVCSLS